MYTQIYSDTLNTVTYSCSYYPLAAGSTGTIPSLVTLLTHPAQQLLGPAEIIKSVTVSDFYTGVVTTTGKVYWW